MLNKKGLTLIELMAVIGIVAILLGIAAVSGRAWMDRYNVETLIKDMHANLLNAKVSAMNRSRMYFVVLTPTQYTIYEDTDTAPNGDEALNAALDTLVSRTNINTRYSMTNDAAQITFGRDGLATTAPPMGTQANFRVTALFGASLDCIALSASRVRMGVWNAGTGTCDAQ